MRFTFCENLPAHPAIRLSVDLLIPLDLCTQLDHVIANLELVPMRMNSSKNDRVGLRQVDLVRKLKQVELFTRKSLTTVVKASKKG